MDELVHGIERSGRGEYVHRTRSPLVRRGLRDFEPSVSHEAASQHDAMQLFTPDDVLNSDIHPVAVVRLTTLGGYVIVVRDDGVWSDFCLSTVAGDPGAHIVPRLFMTAAP